MLTAKKDPDTAAVDEPDVQLPAVAAVLAVCGDLAPGFCKKIVDPNYMQGKLASPDSSLRKGDVSTTNGSKTLSCMSIASKARRQVQEGHCESLIWFIWSLNQVLTQNTRGRKTCVEGPIMAGVHRLQVF